MLDKDYIVGLHSIEEAIKNPKRKNLKLFATSEGMKELKKKQVRLQNLAIESIEPHDLQELAKKRFDAAEFHYSRIPTGLLLEADPLPLVSLDDFYRDVDTRESVRILALDQITDLNNAAAITRTASFYAVDYILLPSRNTFRPTPQFFRIASGAYEYVKMVAVPSLSGAISKLNDRAVETVAFSERATNERKTTATKVCLILGSEDDGISNAVARVASCDFKISSQGAIKSLNVSVATAIAMEKFWS